MAIKGLDFGSLSLMDALDLAVLVEAEAKERYDEFADQMEQHRTPEAAEFFRFMSRNEAKHGAELAERRLRLFGTAPSTVSGSMIFDVEAPDYDKVRAFMSPRQAMKAALSSEVKAHDFFAAAIPTLNNVEVKALFEELRKEEIEHKDLVMAELIKLPPDSPISDEDFVDEPAAQ